MTLRTVLNKIHCNSTGDLLYYALSSVASLIFTVHFAVQSKTKPKNPQYSSWVAWSLHSDHFFVLME